SPMGLLTQNGRISKPKTSSLMGTQVRTLSPFQLADNGSYWQRKSTFLFAIGMSVSSHKLFGWKMLCQKMDAKSENNYVTITFVQLRAPASIQIGRTPQFPFK